MENQEGILLKSSTQIFKSDWRVTEKAREMKNIYYPKIIALRMKEPLNKYVENKQRLQKTLSLWNFLVCVCSSKLFSVIVFEEAGYLSLSNLPWEFVSLSCVGCSALLFFFFFFFFACYLSLLTVFISPSMALRDKNNCRLFQPLDWKRTVRWGYWALYSPSPFSFSHAVSGCYPLL